METGHAVNHGNLNKAIAIVKAIGTRYQPSNDDILLAALILHLAAEKAIFKLVNEKGAIWVIKIKGRQVIFEPLDKLLTKVYNYAASTKISKNVLENIASDIKKIKGIRAIPKLKIVEGQPTDESVNQISAAQTGIDHTINNLDALIQILIAEPLYDPQETEISTDTLTLLLTDIRSINDAVIEAFPPFDNARIERNRLLYGAGGGKELADLVKKYIRSLFGGDSPQYHQIAALKFTKPKQ